MCSLTEEKSYSTTKNTGQANAWCCLQTDMRHAQAQGAEKAEEVRGSSKDRGGFLVCRTVPRQDQFAARMG